MIRRIGYAREISRLQGEIDKYRAEYKEDTERLNELSTNPEAIEQIARKVPDEKAQRRHLRI